MSRLSRERGSDLKQDSERTRQSADPTQRSAAAIGVGQSKAGAPRPFGSFLVSSSSFVPWARHPDHGTTMAAANDDGLGSEHD